MAQFCRDMSGKQTITPVILTLSTRRGRISVVAFAFVVILSERSEPKDRIRLFAVILNGP